MQSIKQKASLISISQDRVRVPLEKLEFIAEDLEIFMQMEIIVSTQTLVN